MFGDRMRYYFMVVGQEVQTGYKTLEIGITMDRTIIRSRDDNYVSKWNP